MLAASGSGMYLMVVFAALCCGFHAVIPFGSLSGVLLDGAIASDLGLLPEQVTLGDAALLFAWVNNSDRKPDLLAMDRSTC